MLKVCYASWIRTLREGPNGRGVTSDELLQDFLPADAPKQKQALKHEKRRHSFGLVCTQITR